MQRRDIVIDILSHTLDALPNHAALLGRRGQLYALQGAWPEAAADYLRFAQLDSGPIGNVSRASLHWGQGVAAVAEGGDSEAYHTYCQRMLERFADPEINYVAERVAKSCLFRPPLASNLQPALHMAERSVALTTPSTEWAVPFAQFAKAMAEYRSGNYQQALDWSRKCLAAGRNVWFRTAQAHLLCAMAYAQLGRAEQARQSIAEAHAVLSKPEPNRDWANGIICQSLLREAEALLEEKDS